MDVFHSAKLIVRRIKPLSLTGSVDSDGRRSDTDTGGAPIVRFFVAARSAASLVSTLESKKPIDPHNRQDINRHEKKLLTGLDGVELDDENDGCEMKLRGRLADCVVFPSLVVEPRQKMLGPEEWY